MENIAIRIEMENGKVMEAELYPEVAPITVENFVELIKEN
ncbi:MAG: peptidylprolyl isomerase, partial [Firmicutes bacterium]|nr:peptidylprolyl isomerase [Candidatus Colivicinus equi]